MLEELKVCEVTERVCKQCRRWFIPKNDELRCPHCLSVRRENRIVKRIENRYLNDELSAIESMMRNNGVMGHRTRKVM